MTYSGTFNFVYNIHNNNTIILSVSRYSHGAVTPLSNLKEAIKPSFDTVKQGSRILMKLKPPDDEVRTKILLQNLSYKLL